MGSQGDMSTSADTEQQPTQADVPPIAQGPVADERQRHRSPSSHSAPQLFDSQLMHHESFDGIGNPAHESHPAEGTTQYCETEDLIINGQIDPHLPDHPAEQDPSNTGNADTADPVKSDIELFEEYLKDPDVETDHVFQTYNEVQDEEQTKGGVAISTLGGTRRLVRRTSTSGSIGGSGRSGDPYGVPLIDYSSPRFPRSAANEGQDDADDDEEVTEVEEDKIPPVVASKRALKPFRTPAIVRSASLESTKRQGHEKRSYSSPPARANRSAPSWKTDNMPLTEPPSPSPLSTNLERQQGAATIDDGPHSIPKAQQASPVTREDSVQQKSRTPAGARSELAARPRTTPAPEAKRKTLAEHPVRRESPRVEQTPRTKMPTQYPGERQAAASPSVRHKPDARFEGGQPKSTSQPSETTARRLTPLLEPADDHDLPARAVLGDCWQDAPIPSTRKRVQPETSSLHPRLPPPERRGRRPLQPHPMVPHVLSPVSERDAELGYSDGSIPHARDGTTPKDVSRGAKKRVHGYDRESSYHLYDESMPMAPPARRGYGSFSRSTTAGRPELDAYAQNRAQAQDLAETEISDEEPDQDVPFDPQAPVAKFDFHTELVEKWDVIQQRMSPVLQEFAEEVLLNTFEAIFTVAHVFHRLNEDTRSELEEGVRQIEAEEAKHEENKKAIEDFSAEIRRVSAMFRGFGNASREASLSRHG